jgi:hypothetical protein
LHVSFWRNLNDYFKCTDLTTVAFKKAGKNRGQYATKNEDTSSVVRFEGLTETL